MKRLLDDPQLSAELRGDLLRSRAAGGQYPTAAKLLQLRAALSQPELDPKLEQEAQQTQQKAQQTQQEPHTQSGLDAAQDVASRGVWHALPSSWKLLAVAAVAGTGALFAVQPAAVEHAAVVELRPQPEVAGQPIAVEQPAPQLEASQPAPAELTVPQLEEVAEHTAPSLNEPREQAPEAAQPTAASPTRPSVSTSRREIAQLVRIRALLSSDPGAALRLAERSEREFPHGLLSEERQALSIIALAKSGAKNAATKRAQRYFARYPHSPMREPIEAALSR